MIQRRLRGTLQVGGLQSQAPGEAVSRAKQQVTDSMLRAGEALAKVADTAIRETRLAEANRQASAFETEFKSRAQNEIIPMLNSPTNEKGEVVFNDFQKLSDEKLQAIRQELVKKHVKDPAALEKADQIFNSTLLSYRAKSLQSTLTFRQSESRKQTTDKLSMLASDPENMDDDKWTNNLEDMREEVDASIKAGALSAQQADELLNRKINEGFKTKMALEIDTSPKNALEKINAQLKELKNSGKSSLGVDADLLLAAKNDAEIQLRRDETIFEARQRKHLAAIKESLDTLEDSYLLNAKNDDIRQQEEFLAASVKGTELESRFNEIQKKKLLFSDFSTKPETQRQAEIETLKATGTVANIKLAGELEKAHNMINKELESNPLGLAASQGYVGSLDPLDLTDDESLPQQLAKRASQAETASQIYDRDVPPLTPGDVSTIQTMMENASSQQKSEMLESIISGLGSKRAFSAMKMFSKNDAGSLATVGALVARGNLKVGEAYFKGEDKLKQSKYAFKNEREFSEELSTKGYIANYKLNNERDAVVGAIRKVYASLVDDSHFKDNKIDTDLLKKASEMVQGKLVKSGGNKVIPPTGMDQNAFDDFVENVTEEDLVAAGGFFGVPSNLKDAFGEMRFKSFGTDVYSLQRKVSTGIFSSDWVDVVKPDQTLFLLDVNRVLENKRLKNAATGTEEVNGG